MSAPRDSGKDRGHQTAFPEETDLNLPGVAHAESKSCKPSPARIRSIRWYIMGHQEDYQELGGTFWAEDHVFPDLGVWGLSCFPWAVLGVSTLSLA